MIAKATTRTRIIQAGHAAVEDGNPPVEDVYLAAAREALLIAKEQAQVVENGTGSVVYLDDLDELLAELTAQRPQP